MQPSTNVVLLKTTIVLLVFCFAECAAGSCMNYGHSCWGGHGKRSGGGLLRARGDGSVEDTRWYLSRLVQPPVDSDLKPWRLVDIHKKPTSTDRQLQNDSGVESDNAKRIEEQKDVDSDSTYEDPESEEVVLMEEPTRPMGQKLRLYKLMKKMQKN